MYRLFMCTRKFDVLKLCILLLAIQSSHVYADKVSKERQFAIPLKALYQLRIVAEHIHTTIMHVDGWDANIMKELHKIQLEFDKSLHELQPSQMIGSNTSLPIAFKAHHHQIVRSWRMYQSNLVAIHEHWREMVKWRNDVRSAHILSQNLVTDMDAFADGLTTTNVTSKQLYQMSRQVSILQRMNQHFDLLQTTTRFSEASNVLEPLGKDTLLVGKNFQEFVTIYRAGEIALNEKTKQHLATNLDTFEQLHHKVGLILDKSPLVYQILNALQGNEEIYFALRQSIDRTIVDYLNLKM